MRKAVSTSLFATLLVSGLAVADGSKPIELTAAQMDAITAGAGMPYGKIIIDATGRSFGQLIGPAKKDGTSAHDNYAGGAKALVEAVLSGGHPIPGA
jgi:hypothetical protein